MRDPRSKGSSIRLAELPRNGAGTLGVQLLVCAVLLVTTAGAQPSAEWRIDTFAGLPDIRDNGPAIDARLDAPSSVVLDGAGNLYIADLGDQRVRKVDPSGVITTIAGTGERGFGGDGRAAVAAQLWSPAGVVLDRAGNLYIADRGNHRIRKVDSSGTITTFAGTGERGFGGDGRAAVAAQLSSPSGVATDGAGNLYIADRGNQRVRKVDFLGVITTVAGTGERGFGGDGRPADQAQLTSPADVAVDVAGNLYIADRGNYRIRKVDSSGTITTFAGSGELGFGGFVGDGFPADEAHLWSPYGVAVDDAGNIYIADERHNRVRKVDSSGIISTVAGSGWNGYGGDGGPAAEARLSSPYCVAVDSAGNIYIADRGNYRIRKVDSSGTITTITGSVKPGDGGPAVHAQLRSPNGVATDSYGNLFIADPGNDRIRKVDSSGIISTVAGTGESGFSGDGGPAIQAQLATPYGVATDGAGNLFIADYSNRRIRKVDSSGVISTVAGSGESYFFGGDGGPAVQAHLGYPADVATDGAGNLFIADRRNDRIRKVDSSGTITTVSGSGEKGFGGDGGPAVDALLNYPAGIAVDRAGNLFIADTSNDRIRKVDSSGVISTVAGTGKRGFGGDGGPAVQAQLSYPDDVATDGNGNLFIADRHNHRIRKVDSSGTITTVAGTGSFGAFGGFGGDGGPAVAAQLNLPRSVTTDGDGNLFIADWLNHRIRVLTQPTDSGGEQAPLLEGIRDLLPF